jgi:hypothetical protein
MKSLPDVAGRGSLITCQADVKIDTIACFGSDRLVLANVQRVLGESKK